MTIALIDGDALVYPICWIAWKGVNPDTYLRRLQGSGTNFEEDPPNVRDRIFEAAKREFEKSFKNILKEVNATSSKMAIRGIGNYRERLYPNYKASRKTGKTSPVKEYVRMLDQWLTETGMAVPANGREADDTIRIWAGELTASGKDHVICATDKDLRCIPGRHYNIRLKWEDYVTPEEGIRVFYQQLLSGDSVDNIPGLPRVGEKVAAKMLEPAVNEIEMQQIVVEKYFEKYELDWYEELLLNGRLLYIQETENADFKDLLDAWSFVQEMR